MSRHNRPDYTLAESEPVVVRAAITALVLAVVRLLVAFQVPISEEQAAAIMVVVDAIGLVVLVLWSRKAVTPNAKVVTRVEHSGEYVAGDADPSSALTAYVAGAVLSSRVDPPFPRDPFD